MNDFTVAAPGGFRAEMKLDSFELASEEVFDGVSVGLFDSWYYFIYSSSLR